MTFKQLIAVLLFIAFFWVEAFIIEQLEIESAMYQLATLVTSALATFTVMGVLLDWVK